MPDYSISLSYTVTVPDGVTVEDVREKIDSQLPQEVTCYVSVTGKDDDGEFDEDNTWDEEVTATLDGSGMTWQSAYEPYEVV